MTVKERTTKARIIEQLDKMDEAELVALEKQLKKAKLEEFRLLDELAAPMSEEDQTMFEEAVRRRSLFGNRKLELPGEKEQVTEEIAYGG